MDSVVHFEVPADDMERAKKFYKAVFGWVLTDMPMPGMTAVSADAALSKEGFYETKANLGMGGTWNVTVRASIPGKPEVKATFAVATGGAQ